MRNLGVWGEKMGGGGVGYYQGDSRKFREMGAR